ncbi:hypothetical protein GWK90_02360 [Candidatus Hamiltonella defensa]|uniref:Uncharacterized protein n=1 Tax=Candidatus Williamhamiltonella defendens TaxID=138072 RepID=A0AAC9VHC5_9ENTR|nr:hypothetical protein [Candidatus Hamiltonella defensa]ASV34250.1 hypothetical protein CJJ18_10185 [Candidatus Hamiltonella defensa]AWK17209.1 hypothetical protein CCS40_10005 [Candidatus Hamiltonella defensa]MBK4361135.1 hypothetical protein [Candidatus Hamiltonella defensa]
MTIFKSSNSTGALAARTNALEKEFYELGKQKKSFKSQIKSVSNSSSQALTTLEENLKNARGLQKELDVHRSELDEKYSRKKVSFSKSDQEKTTRISGLQGRISGTQRNLDKKIKELEKDINNKKRNKELLEIRQKNIGEEFALTLCQKFENQLIENN